jgi:hypothetical protein
MLKQEALRLMQLENDENEDMIKEKIKNKITQFMNGKMPN